MQTSFFWKSWLAPYRWMLYGVAGLFVFTLLFMWFSYFAGNSSVLHWERYQEQKLIETTVHTFSVGPFELQVPADAYIIYEYFNGSSLTPNVIASYVFLVAIMLAAGVILTVITTIDKFWFFLGMATFILFIFYLKFEVLEIFGQRNIIPTIVILVLFCGPAYYFRSFSPETSLLTRWLTFFGLTLLTAGIIYQFSSVSLPMLHLAVTAYIPGLIISFIFMIMVAHELFAGFVQIADQRVKNGFRDFLVVSIIWLLNLLITYLHEIGSIHWNFIYVNLYLALTLSAILGFWGFRHRETLYANIISFHPFGAYFFLAMGAVAFAFIGYALGNANDAAIKVVRSFIIYTQLGFGVTFLLYFLSNFLGLADQNLQVYRVLYKPNRMPYFTFRLSGLIVVIAFIAYSNWHVFTYRSMAGFYNSMGDLYAQLDESTYTEAYYRRAASLSVGDHHSNYILGTMEASELSLEEARDRYALASRSNATDFSRINGGNMFIWQNDPYKAIEHYEAVKNEFGNRPVLYNNLGFAYAKAGLVDSVSYFLDQARKSEIAKDAAETNFFAFAVVNDLPIKADSIVGLFRSDTPGALGNALALAMNQRQAFETKVDPLKEKKLNLYTATLLNNYMLHHAHSLDSSFAAKADSIISDSVNVDFSESLRASLAVAYYHQGNVARAFELLSELIAFSAEDQGKYNYIKGLWALEQKHPESAVVFFADAIFYKFKKAKLYHAISLTEAGLINEAVAAWDQLAESGDEAEKYIASSIRRVLTLPVTNVAALPDHEKYQYFRYRLNANDTTLFNSLVGGFTNPNYKAQALLDMSQKLFNAAYIIPAVKYFNRISGLKITNKKLYDDARFFELEMLASRKEVHQLIRQINKGLEFNTARTLEKTLYAAMVNEMSGDTAAASRNYLIAGTSNPYYDNGVIAAANFFSQRDSTSFQAYDILANAVQLNGESVRLLGAYAKEAARRGFDEYAVSAVLRIEEISRRRQRNTVR
jgi:hypothetical protein